MSPPPSSTNPLTTTLPFLTKEQLEFQKVFNERMADRLETQEEEEEEHWEYRTLNLLQESKLDQKFAAVKLWKSGGTKHTKRWMRRPMAIPELILELQDEKMREYALHCLSKYLLQNWEEERDNYYRTGFLLYNSCCTVTILLKELLVFYQNMVKGNVDGRSSRRVANVLTLLQSIAANSETRTKFITTLVPNFVLPLIQYEYPQVFENVRAVALSVVGILCQARESLIIQWAIKSNMVEICWTSIEAGSELSQVIAMHILEAILQDNEGLSYICSPMCSHLLSKLMITWHHQVEVLARDQDFSPRLLFHIIRCYVLLCNHARGFSVVAHNLPKLFVYGHFHQTTKEYPVIQSLLCQLLVTVGIESAV